MAENDGISRREVLSGGLRGLGLLGIGTATGVVIVGGFLAGLLNILVVGIVLDLFGGYSLTARRT